MKKHITRRWRVKHPDHDRQEKVTERLKKKEENKVTPENDRMSNKSQGKIISA